MSYKQTYIQNIPIVPDSRTYRNTAYIKGYTTFIGPANYKSSFNKLSKVREGLVINCLDAGFNGLDDCDSHDSDIDLIVLSLTEEIKYEVLNRIYTCSRVPYH